MDKKLKDFIKDVARLEYCPIHNQDAWVSKIDGSFICFDGSVDRFEFLLKYGITEYIQDGHGDPKTISIGFNPKEEKWYGWSHRAVSGFGVGSTCKPGDCGFKPSNKEEFIEKNVSFWGDEQYSLNGEIWHEESKEGITIHYIYNEEVPNEKLRGTKYAHFCKYPKTWGRGSWTANTLEEAKQMAIDFAKSIS